MIALVRIALSRPYTFVVLALLLLIVGPLAALRTPTDIFPDIRIPVIGVVWQYTGLPPDEMAGRIITPFQRALTTTVNDIEHIESQVLYRHRHRQDLLPAERRYPHRQRAGHRDLADGAPADAARRDAAADPQLQRLDRADPAARAVGRGPVRAEARSTSASTSCARRWSPCRARRSRFRTAASSARSRSTSIRSALQARGLSGAGRRQRAGRAEPDHAGRHAEDRRVRIHDPAQQRAADDRGAQRPADQDRQRRDDLHARRRHVRDGNPPQTNIVHVDGNRSVLLTVLKSGAASTLDIIAGIKQKLIERQGRAARRAEDRLHRRPVAVRARRDRRASPSKASSRRC